jgi:hypothetical protein
MELSYDKDEGRLCLSLDVPLWLDRLFNPYHEVEPLHPTAIDAAIRDLMERACADMLMQQLTPAYVRCGYKHPPALPTGQE